MLANPKTEIRPLKQADMETVVELLQSNSIYRPNSEDFDIIWQKFSQQQNLHAFVVTKNDIVVGYGCLFVEVKIRGGCVGHIEDIVTDQNYRRIGIGKRLVTHLLQIANEFNCYKAVLQCEENNIPFYEKCGFRQSEFGMSLVTGSLNRRDQ